MSMGFAVLATNSQHNASHKFSQKINTSGTLACTEITNQNWGK